MYISAEEHAKDEAERELEEKLRQGAMVRYEHRLGLFKADGKPLPRFRHAALWFLHNCVVHPLLAVSPTSKPVDLHDLTSKWLNKKDFAFLEEEHVPADIPDRKAWLIHNVVAHIAIGLVPCEATFEFHDKTAEAMKVPNWV